MPDALAQALATEGLWALCLIYLAAGVVRGFSGFGTALIVVPVAGIYLEPAQIILIGYLVVDDEPRHGPPGLLGEEADHFRRTALVSQGHVPYHFGFIFLNDSAMRAFEM